MKNMPRCTIGALVLGAWALAVDVSAITLPTGFAEFPVVSGLNSPTAMAFAPDGRLFVCEQGGQLRVISNGMLLSTPFLTVTVDSSGERGLLGVAFDPNFMSNGFVYVYYTATTPTLHNRVSRFIASGDVALAGSEVVLLDIADASSASNHNGGALKFSADGKLLIAVGERAQPSNSQSLGNLLGKLLRINPDGSIPADNPFFASASGVNRAIWVLGLRNPFTFDVQPGTGRVFVNDVGQSAWEEINDGIAGSNYGWPSTEGVTTNPSFRSPLYAYPHDSSGGCAIVGAAFYNPQTINFPSAYLGRYFFADLCNNWIRTLDPANGNAVTGFAAATAGTPVDLEVGPEGSLYYLARSGGVVRRIAYTAGSAPVITTPPTDQTVPLDEPATFTVTASGTAPLSYQWQRNGIDITGAASSSYTIAAATTFDNGAMFRCRVSNSFGSTTSTEARLTVTNNHRPQASIDTPAAGGVYTAGQTITFSGSATDAEDGTLTGAAFTWVVDFHHDTHTHPHLPPTSGSTTGSFTVPTVGETSTNVWFRIHLIVTDSGGLTRHVQRDIFPRVATVTLSTNPSGLTVSIDGQAAQPAPRSLDGVVGMVRSVGTANQTAGGTQWQFASWSDGGAATHDITVPASATTLTATFVAATPAPTPPPVSVVWTHMVQASATGGTLTKTGGNLAYDAGAISAKSILSGDGYVQFTVASVGYMAVGLGVGDSSQHYGDVDFAVFTRSGGSFSIMEKGVVLGAGGSYSTGDVFRVEIVGGVARYRRNGALVYTSTQAPAYPLVVDTALYSPGVQVGGALMGANNITQTPPVAQAGGPYSAAPGDPVAFSGTGSSDADGTIVSYAWSFGDGATGTGATPTHAYTTAGPYTAVLTVTDNEGLSASASQTVTIGTAPPAAAVAWIHIVQASAAGGTLTKTGSTLDYDAGAISAKSISSGDGFLEFTTTGLGYMAAGLGVGDSSLHYGDVDFAIFTRASGTFSVMEKGVVLSAGGAYAAGDVFRVEIVGGTARYRRNGGLVYASTLVPAYPLVVDTALYTPGVQVASARMGGSSLTQQPPVANAGGPYAGVSGDAVAFDGGGSSDPDGAIVTYAWAFGDGGSGTGPNPSHAYASAGSYIATLTVTDSDGLTATSSRTVTVSNPPTPVAVVWTNLVQASASGSTLTKTGGNLAYDAGAVSTASIPSGDGYLEFTASTLGYMGVGLGVGDSSQHYGDLDFAIFTRASGSFSIMERGYVLPVGGTCAAGDVFRVEIVGGLVRYRRNGSVLYTSTQVPAYPLVVDTALYTPGVQVGNARLAH
jgi:glucose/arabinose dehydrogenase/PKD repeat protein